MSDSPPAAAYSDVEEEFFRAGTRLSESEPEEAEADPDERNRPSLLRRLFARSRR